MTVHSLFASLDFVPFLAQAPKTSETGQMVSTISMFAIMGLMMYLIILRPQRQRQKALNALMSNLKAGDKVLTSSGIIATVITVKDKTVSIRSADSKLEILKSTISEITEKAGAEAVQA
jgi:preprotein translocase subunit YajC